MDERLTESPASSVQPVDGSNSPKIALFVLIPILLILVAICVVLMVVVYLSIRRRERKHSRYQPVPTKDGNSDGVTLPYPPSVKLSKSAYPHLEYSLATQLPQPLDVPSTRYPFMQHMLPGPQYSIQERRPPRLRTKRRGNHKHRRGKHVILGRQETIADSDHSPTPEPESNVGTKMCQLPPRKNSPNNGSPPRPTGSKPEISLTFRYDDMESILAIKIEKVVNLPLREDGSEVDGYVRLHFTPVLPSALDIGTSRTQTRRKSSSPVFEEELTYSNLKREEMIELTLHIEVLDYKSYGKHAVLVQTEIDMRNVKFFDGNCRLTLPLEPPKFVRQCNGVIFLSLCFDADGKKLSVIILRAKDLNNGRAEETDPYAKISISIKDRLVAKLKTKRKPCSSSPIFNEAVSCTVDMDNIQNVQVTVALFNDKRQGKYRELGTAVLGSKTTGNELRHWNDTITSPGKHIAEWHDLVCSC